MDYNLLGPLEVRGADGLVPLGGLKQRAVLAVLLVESGRVVGFDTVIDRVWNHRPPPKATASLRSYVANLRRALSAGSGPAADGGVRSSLTTVSWGYRFDLGDDALDIALFEDLAHRGRGALAAGDPYRAEELLGRALAMWRGPALAEFVDLPFAADERARARELHDLVVESRIDAALELGRYAELVPELERRVIRAPLREKVWGQLMIALDRAGRRGDALDAFRRAEGLLHHDLGVGPSRYLCEIEAMIATGRGVNPAVNLVAL